MFNWPGRRVKSSTLSTWISIVSLVGGIWGLRAQTVATNAPARATGFSLPYKKEGRTVALFTGADHKPLSVTAVQIRDFRVETYQPDGTPNLQGTAPECHLDISTRKITSSGSLNVTQAGVSLHPDRGWFYLGSGGRTSATLQPGPRHFSA